MKSKKCTRCGEIKSLDQFHKDKNVRSGVRGACKTCCKTINANSWSKMMSDPKKRERWRTYFREKQRLRYIARPKPERVRLIPKKLRLRFLVMQRDDFSCCYCGRKPPDVQLQIDHIIPRSKGGSDDMENLRTACRECNMGKSDLLLS